MILPKPADAAHKYQMFRLLSALLAENQLAQVFVFKGGTCAALRGWLDRFSIDLDFDLLDKQAMSAYRKKLHIIFKRLGFTIKDESRRHLQFFLKYPSPAGFRNTVKLEINDNFSPLNRWETVNLNELNLTALTQTRSTMVANKLYAAGNRYRQHRTIAGRDFYDLHFFLTQGYDLDKAIVEERTGKPFGQYIGELIRLIEKRVTDTILYEDINPLLPAQDLKKSIKDLRKELLWMLRGIG